MPKTTDNWVEWLRKSRFSYMSEEQVKQTIKWLFEARDVILDRASLKPGDTVIDIGSGTGFIAFGVHERLNGTGKVIASDKFQECLDECKNIALSSGIDDIEYLQSDACSLDIPDNSVDVAVMRSVLVHVVDKSKAIKEIFRVLKPGGRFSIFEPVINSNTAYYQIIEPSHFTDYEKIKDAEIKIMSDPNDPLTNFSAESLKDNFKAAGFSNVDLFIKEEKSTYVANAGMIDPWLNTPAGSGNKTSKERFLEHLSEEEVNRFIEELKVELDGKEITLKSFSAYISGVK